MKHQRLTCLMSLILLSPTVTSCGSRLGRPEPNESGNLDPGLLHSTKGLIAFVGETDSESRAAGDSLFIVSPTDGTPKLLDRNVVGPIAWSPDGEQIAYSHPVTEAAGIYVVRVKSGRIERLTTSRVFEGNPAWSPDGRRIAYLRGRREIRLYDFSTRTSESLHKSFGRLADLCWSEDGSCLFFLAEDVTTRERFGDIVQSRWFVRRLDLKSRKTVKCHELPAAHVTCSPKDGKVAVVLNRNGSRELFVGNLEFRDLTSVSISDFGPTAAYWSPDGGGLLVAALRPDGFSSKDIELFHIDLTHDRVTRLTENEVPEDSPSWSADSTKVVFERHGKVVILNVADRKENTLTDGRYPQWSPK